MEQLRIKIGIVLLAILLGLYLFCGFRLRKDEDNEPCVYRGGYLEKTKLDEFCNMISRDDLDSQALVQLLRVNPP